MPARGITGRAGCARPMCQPRSRPGAATLPVRGGGLAPPFIRAVAALKTRS